MHYSTILTILEMKDGVAWTRVEGCEKRKWGFGK